MTKPSLLFIPLDWHKRNVQMPFFEGLQTIFDCYYFTGSNAESTKKRDYIYCQAGALPPMELYAIKKRSGAKVFVWTGDCRPDLLPEVLQYKGVTDRTFLACGIGQQKEYERALESPVFWLQHAAHMFLEPQEISDRTAIAFVGNYYDQFPGGAERNKLCYDLDVKYEEDFYCYGSWSESRGKVPYDDVPWIYNNAFVSISANIFNDIEGYWSNRPYDILAAGGCCLMRYVPGYERHFTDMEDVLVYRWNEEAMELIEWLLANPDERNRIAKNGYKNCLANHTNANRAKELWDHL